MTKPDIFKVDKVLQIKVQWSKALILPDNTFIKSSNHQIIKSLNHQIIIILTIFVLIIALYIPITKIVSIR